MAESIGFAMKDSTFHYLLINSDALAIAGKFYLLPKIHKKSCPGRLVICGCNTPTEKLSAFCGSSKEAVWPSG